MMQQVLKALRCRDINDLKTLIQAKAEPIYLRGPVACSFMYKGFLLQFNSNGMMDKNYKYSVRLPNGNSLLF